MLIKLTEDMMDIDNRNDQYFLRVYHFHPLQNTQNNMKEIKKQILENQRIVEKTEEWKDQLEKEVAEHDNKHARFILSCVNTILANAIVQESSKE